MSALPPSRFAVGDIVIVEDPPTGAAHLAEGVVIAIREDGFATIQIEGERFDIWHYDVSRKAQASA